MRNESLVLLAGGIAFSGSFAEADGFPPNGYNIISATAALTILSSLTNDTAIAPVVKGLASLLLLSAVYVYVPAFTRDKKRGKKHG